MILSVDPEFEKYLNVFFNEVTLGSLERKATVDFLGTLECQAKMESLDHLDNQVTT